MITVRFPTGFSIQYNTANFVESWGTSYKLLTKQGGELLSVVPQDCVMEWQAPCRNYNPIATDSDKVQASVESLAKDVRSLTRKLAKK